MKKMKKFKVKINYECLKVRKRLAPGTRIQKSKKLYTRKRKFKNIKNTVDE